MPLNYVCNFSLHKNCQLPVKTQVNCWTSNFWITFTVNDLPYQQITQTIGEPHLNRNNDQRMWHSVSFTDHTTVTQAMG